MVALEEAVEDMAAGEDTAAGEDMVDRAVMVDRVVMVTVATAMDTTVMDPAATNKEVMVMVVAQ